MVDSMVSSIKIKVRKRVKTPIENKVKVMVHCLESSSSMTKLTQYAIYL